MNKFLILILTFLLSSSLVFADTAIAKGGGGRGGGGRSSSSSRSSTRTAPKPAPKPKTPQQLKAEAKTDAVRAKQQAQEAQYSKNAAKQPTTRTVNGKAYKKGQTVGVNGYSPRFANGYSAPAGSVVYYPASSALDWLPFYFLMTHSSQREAVVRQPDGKEQVVKEEGTDGMYIFNWLMVILLTGGAVWFLVWLVNKRTRPSYSY